MSTRVARQDPQQALAASASLVRDGRLMDAIALLSAANRAENSFALEARLVELRHAAWQDFAAAPPRGDWPRPAPDLFRGAHNPPECTREALTPALLASAIQHYGSLIVRGLFSPSWCAVLRQDIDQSMDAARRWVTAPEARQPSEWFAPFAPAQHELGPLDRKMLSEIAINDPAGFTAIAERARQALKTSPEKTAARSVPRI